MLKANMLKADDARGKVGKKNSVFDPPDLPILPRKPYIKKANKALMEADISSNAEFIIYLAIQHDIPLVHNDRDFILIEKHLRP